MVATSVLGISSSAASGRSGRKLGIRNRQKQTALLSELKWHSVGSAYLRKGRLCRKIVTFKQTPGYTCGVYCKLAVDRFKCATAKYFNILLFYLAVGIPTLDKLRAVVFIFNSGKRQWWKSPRGPPGGALFLCTRWRYVARLWDLFGLSRFVEREVLSAIFYHFMGVFMLLPIWLRLFSCQCLPNDWSERPFW